MYSRDPRIPTETVLSQPQTPYQIDMDDYKSEMIANMSDAWKLSRENIKMAQLKQRTGYDKHSREVKLKVGDRVLVYMPGEVRGKAWKLARPFHGPYRVLALMPTNAEVRLVDCPTSESIFVPLSRLGKSYEELSNETWTGAKKRTRIHLQRKKNVDLNQSKKRNSTNTCHQLSPNRPITRSMTRGQQN